MNNEAFRREFQRLTQPPFSFPPTTTAAALLPIVNGADVEKTVRDAEARLSNATAAAPPSQAAAVAVPSFPTRPAAVAAPPHQPAAPPPAALEHRHNRRRASNRSAREGSGSDSEGGGLPDLLALTHTSAAKSTIPAKKAAAPLSDADAALRSFVKNRVRDGVSLLDVRAAVDHARHTGRFTALGFFIKFVWGSAHTLARSFLLPAAVTDAAAPPELSLGASAADSGVDVTTAAPPHPLSSSPQTEGTPHGDGESRERRSSSGNDDDLPPLIWTSSATIAGGALPPAVSSSTGGAAAAASTGGGGARDSTGAGAAASTALASAPAATSAPAASTSSAPAAVAAAPASVAASPLPPRASLPPLHRSSEGASRLSAASPPFVPVSLISALSSASTPLIVGGAGKKGDGSTASDGSSSSSRCIPSCRVDAAAVLAAFSLLEEAASAAGPSRDDNPVTKALHGAFKDLVSDLNAKAPIIGSGLAPPPPLASSSSPAASSHRRGPRRRPAPARSAQLARQSLLESIISGLVPGLDDDGGRAFGDEEEDELDEDGGDDDMPGLDTADDNGGYHEEGAASRHGTAARGGARAGAGSGTRSSAAAPTASPATTPSLVTSPAGEVFLRSSAARAPAAAGSGSRSSSGRASAGATPSPDALGYDAAATAALLRETGYSGWSDRDSEDMRPYFILAASPLLEDVTTHSELVLLLLYSPMHFPRLLFFTCCLFN